MFKVCCSQTVILSYTYLNTYKTKYTKYFHTNHTYILYLKRNIRQIFFLFNEQKSLTRLHVQITKH